jgi:hypothetical protein
MLYYLRLYSTLILYAFKNSMCNTIFDIQRTHFMLLYIEKITNLYIIYWMKINICKLFLLLHTDIVKNNL